MFDEPMSVDGDEVAMGKGEMVLFDEPETVGGGRA